MKLNEDLIRAILFRVQDAPAGETVYDFSGLGANDATTSEHLVYLHRKGLIEGPISEQLGNPVEIMVTRLTPAGHDFVEQARNDGLWMKAKSALRDKGLGVTVELLSAVLQDLARKALS